MRNVTREIKRTSRYKKTNGKYGMLAMLMLVFLFGGFLLIEHMALVHLSLAVIFCAVSGAMLLYALMKMNVMEFQPGSFWARVNQYVNREEPAVHSKQAVRNIVYAMIVNK